MPEVGEMTELLKLAAAAPVGRAALGQSRLRPEDPQMGGGAAALVNMVAAARELRALA